MVNKYIYYITFTSIFCKACSQVTDRQTGEAQTVSDMDVATQPGFGSSLKDIPKSLKILLTNGAFVATACYGTCDALLLGGFESFGPKYFQQQFQLSSSTAGIVFGQCFSYNVLNHFAYKVRCGVRTIGLESRSGCSGSLVSFPVLPKVYSGQHTLINTTEYKEGNVTSMGTYILSNVFVFFSSPGAVAVPGGAGGFIVGSYLIKRFKLSCEILLRAMFLIAVACIFFFVALTIQCDNSSFAGIVQRDGTITKYDSDKRYMFTVVSKTKTSCELILFMFLVNAKLLMVFCTNAYLQ